MADCDVTEFELDNPSKACTNADGSMANHNDTEAESSAESSDEGRDFVYGCDDSCEATEDTPSESETSCSFSSESS